MNNLLQEIRNRFVSAAISKDDAISEIIDVLRSRPDHVDGPTACQLADLLEDLINL